MDARRMASCREIEDIRDRRDVLEKHAVLTFHLRHKPLPIPLQHLLEFQSYIADLWPRQPRILVEEILIEDEPPLDLRFRFGAMADANLVGGARQGYGTHIVARPICLQDRFGMIKMFL